MVWLGCCTVDIQYMHTIHGVFLFPEPLQILKSTGVQTLRFGPSLNLTRVCSSGIRRLFWGLQRPCMTAWRLLWASEWPLGQRWSHPVFTHSICGPQKSIWKQRTALVGSRGYRWAFPMSNPSIMQAHLYLWNLYHYKALGVYEIDIFNQEHDIIPFRNFLNRILNSMGVMTKIEIFHCPPSALSQITRCKIHGLKGTTCTN